MLLNSMSWSTCSKSILIFGGAGSLGTVLVKKYLDEEKTCVTIASRDEAKHWELRNKFPKKASKLNTLICDIRNEARVKEVLFKTQPSVVIIASAMKQVDTCEYFPEESVETNILGIRNILRGIESLRHARVEVPIVCFVSTDKSVNPINTYGMCKAISERLVMNSAKSNWETKHVVVRYGNVLNSKGSIIPALAQQAANPDQKYLTLTDDRMTRFMMTLEESVELIDLAIRHGVNGQLWIPKLDSMKIADLMRYFSEKSGKEVMVTGIRPGEKLHELLLNETDMMLSTPRSYGGRDYFVINDGTPDSTKNTDYSSKDHAINPVELTRRIDEFLEKGTYVRNTT